MVNITSSWLAVVVHKKKEKVYARTLDELLRRNRFTLEPQHLCYEL